VRTLETTAAWRRLGNVFLGVFVPIYHIVGGFFIVEFFLSAEYTWGYTLRTFVLFMSNLVLAYEFVYRDLQASHPEWPKEILKKSVMKYSVIPFSAGVATALMLQITRYWAH
jgi:hypothetical protein